MRFFFIFLIFISSFISEAQDLVFKSFTVKEGLPGNVTYDVIQDSKGYIWVATENGVSRFDGKIFKNYTIQDGLADNEIFKVREDSLGRIWFLSYNGRLSYYLNGYIYNSANTSFLKNLDFSFIAKGFYEDQSGNIWFSSAEEGIKVLLPDSTVKHYIDKAGTFNEVYDFNQINDSLFAYSHFTTILITGDGVFQEPISKVFTAQNQHEQQFYELKNKVLLSKNTLFSLPTKVGSLSCVLQDINQKLWIGTKSGLFILENGSWTKFLSNIYITAIHQDIEGNTWIGTLGNGIFMSPSLPFFHIKQFNEKQFPAIHSLHYSGNELLAGTQTGSIFRLSADKFETKEIKLSNTNDLNKVRKIYKDTDGKVWCGTDKGVFVIENDLPQKIIGDVSVKDMVAFSDSLFIATNIGVLSVNLKSRSYATIYKSRSTSVIKDSNALWIGTLKGIYTPEMQVLYANYFARFSEKRITKLFFEDGSLVIGTYGEGVFILNSNKIAQYSEKNGLVGGIVLDVVKKSNGDLWVLTNRALNKLSFDKDKPDIISYSSGNGLLSDQLNTFVLHNDTVFVGTDQGLTFFSPTSNAPYETSPAVFITSLEVNNTAYDLERKISLSYDQNNLRFDFTGIAISSLGDIKFQYILEGLEKSWSEAENTHVVYRALKPGQYTFKVRTVTKHGKVSENEANLRIRIEPYFADTNLFKISLSTLLVLLILLLFWRYFRKYRKNHQQKLKLMQLEHSALRSQMNPHFLFNTLNSIQHFVLSEDKRTANKYLVMFANLIRKYLDNSLKLYINVGEEIASLELYIQLENLRMNNRINLVLTKPETEVLRKHIPAMLLQPLVENAFYHALFPLISQNEEAKLEITFTEKGNNLFISILDNGAGFELKDLEKPNQFSGKHKSTALKNISERIEILNKAYGFKAEINFLKPQNQNGTLVCIILPLIDEQL
jgi:ligand-binding sensor domain-containing protein